MLWVEWIMTKLLDQAVARLRELPDEEQDAMAETLFAHLAGRDESYRLTEEQAKEVRRRLADPNPGFMSLEEVRARFAQRRA